MGIEPTYPAWKAGVLPLNYTRMLAVISLQQSGWQDSNLRPPGPKPGALAKLSHTPFSIHHFPDDKSYYIGTPDICQQLFLFFSTYL